MFSNTQHVNIFGSRPLCLESWRQAPHKENIHCHLKQNKTNKNQSAFLLHINHVLDLKNSKLHKHHLSLFLNQTNTTLCFSHHFHRSLYTPEKSKGPASVHTTRPTHGKEKSKKQTFGFLCLMTLLSMWKNSLIGRKHSLLLSRIIKGVKKVVKEKT